MANRQARNTALLHLARSVVRESPSLPDFFEKLVRALDEEAKRLELVPSADPTERAALNSDARLVEKLVHAHRREFS